MTTPLLESLLWRRSVKNFDPNKQIPKETLDVLLESLRLSASSYGLQPWKFLLVDNAEARKKLYPYTYNQSQILDASAVIVLCRKVDIDESTFSDYVDYMASVRELDSSMVEQTKKKLIVFFQSRSVEELDIWVRSQVYIALGSLLTACAIERIDACPMEGFDSIAYDRILSLKEKKLKSTVLCTLGYRDQSDTYSKQEKVRYPKSQVILKFSQT